MNKRKETTATRFAVETEIGVAFVIQTGRNESRVILNSPSTKCQIHWITPRSFASTFLLSLLFRRAQESKFFLSIWIKLPRLEKLNVSISGKWYQMESWRTFRREFASNVALSLSLSLSLSVVSSWLETKFQAKRYFAKFERVVPPSTKFQVIEMKRRWRASQLVQQGDAEI